MSSFLEKFETVKNKITILEKNDKTSVYE